MTTLYKEEGSIMKRKFMFCFLLLQMVATVGFAANNTFDEVPKTDWSYTALHELVNSGFFSPEEGEISDDRVLTRYDIALVTAKAVAKSDKATSEQKEIIDKLSNEYANELKGLNEVFEKKAPDKTKIGIGAESNVKLYGNVHLRWDSDKTGGKLNTTGGRHAYLDLEGEMKANDNWVAHFQAEDKNRYISYNNAGDESKFAERIWLEGKVGKTNITAGRKWWWLGSGLMFAHSMDGIKVDIPTSQKSTASFFFMHPAEVSGTTEAGNSSSYMALGDYEVADLFGAILSNDFGNGMTGSLMLGGNKHTVDHVNGNYADVTRWGELGINKKFTDTLNLGLAYSRTNAESYNQSYRIGLNYKGANINAPKSFGIGLNYLNLGRYGDILHDDFWGYQWSDSKILSLNLDYMIDKNVMWTTYYSWQKRNISGLGGYWNALSYDYEAKNTNRRVFFTELKLMF